MSSTYHNRISLATQPLSGLASSTSGSFLTLQNQTFTDNTTASSGTATAYNAVYIGAPTIAATNTAVTTQTASTITVVGPPTSGTNQTISSAYALNVINGISYFGGDIFVKSLTSTFVAGTQPSGVTNPSYYVWNPTPSTSYTNTLTGFTWSADGRFFYPNSVQPLLLSWSSLLGTNCEMNFSQNTTDGNAGFNTVGNLLAVTSTGAIGDTNFTYIWHPPSVTSYIGTCFYGQGTSMQAGSGPRNMLKITRFH